MPEERYEFDEDSLDAVAAAGLDVPAVLAVLHGRPRQRPFIGGRDLYISGPTPAGRMVIVGLTEKADNIYRVVSAQFASEDQAAQLRRRLNEGGAL